MSGKIYVQPVTLMVLEAMSTARLLAYQRRLMRVRETRSEDCGHVDPHPVCGPIKSKDDPRWGILRSELRVALDTRENV